MTESEILEVSQGYHRRHALNFYGTIITIYLLAIVTTLDSTITTAALPRIVMEVDGAEKFIWIMNTFSIAFCVAQPLIRPLIDRFGQRRPLIAATVLFAPGSGVSGAAQGPKMLIAGRAIQGVGASAVQVLINYISSETIPYHKQGSYNRLLFSLSSLAYNLGPFLGGAIAGIDWRWIFLVNIPICALALATTILFVPAQNGPKGWFGHDVANISLPEILRHLVANMSMMSVLYGLCVADSKHAWISEQTILPILLGLLGWIGFCLPQMFAPSPGISSYFFQNRTLAACLGLTFISSAIVQSTLFFLPLYFQGALGTTALGSGLTILPYTTGVTAFIVFGALFVNRFGAYRRIQAAAFALFTIGLALLALLDSNSTPLEWIVFQLVASAGTGIIWTALLPKMRVTVLEEDEAIVTTACGSFRAYSHVWGVSVSSVIFKAVFNHHLDHFPSADMRQLLRDGRAYAYAADVHNLRRKAGGEMWDAAAGLYSKSLRVIWWLGFGLSLLGGLLVAVQGSVEWDVDMRMDY